MATVTERDLNQRTAEVLAQASVVGEMIVTERGEPRWRVSSYRGQDDPLARAERQGRFTPPASTQVPWPRALSEGEALFSRVGLFDITRETHAVAESIERHVRTLDALHLATALLVGDCVTVATHDVTKSRVAENLGLDTVDPVASR